jgi:hypothetical protein
MANAHEITIRDLRARFGDPDVFAAQCSCGWSGEQREGHAGHRSAVRDGALHVEGSRPARNPRPGAW